MAPIDDVGIQRIPLSVSQQNIYRGALQDPDPRLYLIGKSYRFHPVELPAFLSALDATILGNPIQLCVLTPPETESTYPDLVARLRFDDIVCVRSPDSIAAGLEDTWSHGIIGTALVRYTVQVDASVQVVGLQVHTHHIVLDGGATAIIEADLARYLGGSEKKPCATTAMAALVAVHRRENAKVAEAAERFTAAVRGELTEGVGRGGQGAHDAMPGTSGRGRMRESVRVPAAAYDAIVGLAETRAIPLNVLVAGAAVAVQASLRQNTESLVVYPVDNRFGDPELDVATCLVNSVAQLVRFPPFAAVEEVVAALDRGYVKAVRRRWFREERYRRMYLAINRSAHVEALTINFMRGRCAPELLRHLCEPPAVTDIGPVEGVTVACVHDETERTLEFAIWDRADLPEHGEYPGFAARIVTALQAMVSGWDGPIAATVGDWLAVAADGRLDATGGAPRNGRAPARAWFVDGMVDCRAQRPFVDRWLTRIVGDGIESGDVVVFTDDDSDRAIDLLIACHLAGCGYSVCAVPGDVGLRAEEIGTHCGVVAHVIDIGTELPAADPKLVGDRIDEVAQDHSLGARLAYVMPTSGSTGQPKLVPISHDSLAVFCAAVGEAYGWGAGDTVLQCAPLTSDISVEEVFGALCSGARVVRSASMRAGDVQQLAHDVAAAAATVLDLPTAIWHLICEDSDAMAALGRSALRQIIVGGEPIRSTAVDKWINSVGTQPISLVSTYGPTETTVVVTELPIVHGGFVAPADARARLGRPLVPDSVFVAFGEVVVVGELVSAGYLGMDSVNFGTVRTADGARRRVFATADRVLRDDAGFPVFAGRRDAVVKISGRRVDTAEVMRRMSADPELADVAVEVLDTGLGIWFETAQTRCGIDDSTVAMRIRITLRHLGVPAFSVIGARRIPRKLNGKVDRAMLAATVEHSGTATKSSEGRADRLAAIWSHLLGRTIGPDSSLLDEGVGSLELIRILPDTRKFLDWQLSILDLIGADTAANVVDFRPTADTWMDADTTAQIARDLAALKSCGPAPRRRPVGDAGRSIVILGASGILGTGFAQAILDLKRTQSGCPDVVLAARSNLPERDPWWSLRNMNGVRVIPLPDRFGSVELGAVLDEVGAHTLVNCIGNTNVLVPYRDLRPANVEAVPSIVEACARGGTRLVHLSTFVVNGEVAAPRVTDPRAAPYPYAASKSLAELVVTHAPDDLDFTIVRLPRVLGDAHQLERSTDILVSLLDACAALQVAPAVPLIEEVTTGLAAANSIVGLLPELSAAIELGRGVTVLRGQRVPYTEFLGEFAGATVDLAEWKQRLDRSAWSRRNPLRWAVIDAWVGLGARLAGRTYGDYLAQYPTVDIEVESVAEVASEPGPLRDLLAR
ncbi:MAG: AMP-binding protein [Mycobacterium sp.]